MGYISPKMNSGSSFVSPSRSTDPFETSLNKQKPTLRNGLDSFRNLLTSYLEVSEQIEFVTGKLEQLKKQKENLEAQIANDPQYEKIANLINSMKGPRK